MEKKLYTVGIAAPMSGTSAEHNADFFKKSLRLIQSAFPKSQFETPMLVSQTLGESDILNSIVRNVYESDILVADETDKNPNVAFELGMRAAFDKPFMLVSAKSSGRFSDFNLQMVHFYPDDMGFPDTDRFKDELREACLTQLRKRDEDPTYSPFLKSHTIYHPSSLPTNNKSVGYALSDLQARISKIEKEYPEAIKNDRRSTFQYMQGTLFELETSLVKQGSLDNVIHKPFY